MNKPKMYQSSGKGALIKLDHLKESKNSFSHHRRNQLSLKVLPKQESANQYFGEDHMQLDPKLKDRNMSKINSEEKLKNSAKLYSVDDYKSASKINLPNQNYNDIKRSCFRRTRSNAKSFCDKNSLIPVMKNLSFDFNASSDLLVTKNQDLTSLNKIAGREVIRNQRPSVDFVINKTAGGRL